MVKYNLLPCPFCGHEAEFEKLGSPRRSMIVACTNCGCRLESGDVFGLTSSSGLAWNSRLTHCANRSFAKKPKKVLVK